LGSTTLETIQEPDEASELLQFVMTDSDFKKQYGELSGWVPDTEKGDTESTGFKKRLALYEEQKFEGMYPLKDIFGFFQLYNRIIYLINFELRMVKNQNYEKIFYGTIDEADKTKVKPTLHFEELKLMIPSITCNPELETSIIERLNNPKPITVDFLERISSSVVIPEGTKYSFKPLTLNTRPRFILIGFKDETASYKTNNSKFIQKDGDNQITSLRVQLNSSYYPLDPMDFDSKKNYNAKPYFSYTSMCKRFGVDPQLSYEDFKNIYSVFCIDVSEQDEKLALNGVNVTFEITKTNGFKPRCFWVVLVEKEATIELNSGKMTTIS
jgi:hypothetical protein